MTIFTAQRTIFSNLQPKKMLPISSTPADRQHLILPELNGDIHGIHIQLVEHQNWRCELMLIHYRSM
ncbi:hypothetical protein GC101_06540 [Paenibacillus sp. LMG 31459]|uniref:Uncharacterized protein n=1 Tax=Paenibacillus phytohabitans TaxID=2654978 RepID=A0ABX1YC47_9BACL|nr:hypothetical protein [Paenibacillus phytohabitans]